MKKKFNIKEFRNLAGENWLGSEVLYLDSVESTNTYLKNLDHEKISHGMMAVTDDQTNGRGQFRKKWLSEPNQNLTFTLLFTPSRADGLMLLTVAAASAISKIIEELTNVSSEVKWPNDIFLNGKKIGGVLTECLFMGTKPERVLLGIGLNINQVNFSGELENSATSLKKETGKNFSRELVLSRILSAIQHLYGRWHKMERDLPAEVNKSIEGYGEWVSITLNGKLQDGSYKFLGINEKGECIFLNEELDVYTFSHEQIRIITGSNSISETA